MKAALLLLALPLAGCVDVVSRVSSGSGASVVGTGKAVVETRAAETANAVEASGAVTVEIGYAAAPQLKVEAQQEILPHLKTSFSGGTLKVWMDGSASTSGKTVVRYNGPNVRDLSADGASTITAKGLRDGGDSKIHADGASTITATGKTGRLTITADGASTADLGDLEAREAKAEASGASTIHLWAKKAVEASADGASTIGYKTPVAEPVKSSANGASTVGPE